MYAVKLWFGRLSAALRFHGRNAQKHNIIDTLSVLSSDSLARQLGRASVYGELKIPTTLYCFRGNRSDKLPGYDPRQGGPVPSSHCTH